MYSHLKFVLYLFSLSILSSSLSRPNSTQNNYGNQAVTNEGPQSINLLPIANHRICRQSFTLKDPPAIRYEAWGGHNDKIFLVHFDPDKHVVVYFASTFGPLSHWRFHVLPIPHWTYHGDASWLFKFVPRVWDYMKRTYGNFGSDPYLYLIAHQGDHSLPYHEYSLQTDIVNSHIKTNLLDVSSPEKNGWLTSRTRSTETDILINELGFFVEFSSKNRLRSPTYNLWNDPSSLKSHTAWTDIFTLDVHTSLNMTADAERIKSELISKFQKNGGNDTYWFRDWLLPIYENYGGTKTLNEYFQVLSNTIPYDGLRYQYELNLGEFVYFWSTAAKADLRDLAKSAFPWTDGNEDEFLNATLTFSAVIQVPPIAQEPPNSVDLSSSVIGQIIGGAVVSLLIVLLVGSFIFYKRKIKILRTEIRALTNQEVKEFFDGDSNLKSDVAQFSVLSLPFIKEFEIQRDQLTIREGEIIGSGQFGCVMHGLLKITENDELMPVAVKTVKAEVEVLQFKAILSEAKIMAFVGRHENIVRLLATYTANIKNREIFIVLELCPLGDLRKFLIKNENSYRNIFATLDESELQSAKLKIKNIIDEYTALRQISTLDLLRWDQEVSNAMMYLTEKKVIHADLAARYILLTRNRVAQISDFGLSRQLLNCENYKKTSEAPLPWRWMAIESLTDMKFSVASDVWSFGVMLWEIFSFGKMPYPGWNWNYNFVDRLLSGERLAIPQYANTDLYNLMKDCWRIDQIRRPTFESIYIILEEIISNLMRNLSCEESAQSEDVENGGP